MGLQIFAPQRHRPQPCKAFPTDEHGYRRSKVIGAGWAARSRLIGRALSGRSPSSAMVCAGLHREAALSRSEPGFRRLIALFRAGSASIESVAGRVGRVSRAVLMDFHRLLFWVAATRWFAAYGTNGSSGRRRMSIEVRICPFA